MAYQVSETFREKCYSGSSEYRCRLLIDGTEVPRSQISYIKINSPILDNSNQEQSFYVGTFVSQKITIKFKNLDGLNIESNKEVELYISQLTSDENSEEEVWEEVPIGKYLIDELQENYQQTCEINCLDYAIKFSDAVDYSVALNEEGTITIDELLIWLCNYYGVELGDYPTTNGDVVIATYDNTISGKRYISYIAELKGCNAKLDRYGRLILVPLNRKPVVEINALKSKSLTIKEKYQLSKVVYFDAVRNFTFGDDTGNTLYIRQDNMFITDEEVVKNIYDVLTNEPLILYSLATENYGDISLDCWDIILYKTDKGEYPTLNNNEITYQMTIMSKVDTSIPNKIKEVTTNIIGGNEEQKVRRIETRLNQVDGQIELLSETTAEQSEELATLTLDSERITSQVTEQINELQTRVEETITSTTAQFNILNQTIKDGVEKLKNELIVIDINGIRVSTNISKISTLITNDTFAIVNDQGVYLAYFGYSEEEKRSISQMDNLTITNFFTAGAHRQEKFRDTSTGEIRTGWAYTGGVE